MNAAMETITPKKAQIYLTTNIENNRPVVKNWVDSIAKQMDKGKWLQNGDSIKFQAPNGNGIEHLIDGQHRLLAIIKLGEAVEMLVVRGLSDKAFQTIDAGKKRTAADCLAIAGYKQSTTLAAATRLLCNFRLDWTFPENKYMTVTNTDILEMVQVFPKIQESCNIGHRGRFIVPGSHLVFLHFLTAINHPDESIDFVTKLSEGTNLAKGDPILAFRERMFKYKAANVRLRRQFSLGLLFKAWNYHYENRRIEKLRFAVNEEFPIIKGFDRKNMFGEDYPVEAIEAQVGPARILNDKQGVLFDDKK